MNEIKTLADQLRSKIAQPEIPPGEPANAGKKKTDPAKPKANKSKPPDIPPLLIEIQEYDNTDHKSMVHARFDPNTVALMNHFKMATGVDVTKLVAFSVKKLFENHPELKTIIQQFIQNLQL